MASDLLSTPPPLAPPRLQDETAAWLRLIRSYRVGPSTFYRLLDEHGSATAALDALPAIASAAGVARYTPCSLDLAEAELARGAQIGAQLLCFGSPDYPRLLAELDEPPPVIWAQGNLALLQRQSVSIVGARNASSLGGRMAQSLASKLGEAGYAITSGLARGIDAAAHVAALETGTIAVQAGGLASIYPKENAGLQDNIAAQGLRLSERPPDLQPQAKDFPRRNRIISGLSRTLIVVEAAAKSGSLITARNALDQGRDVLAVPGHPFDARAAGCNMLIRDGATLVRSARDVIDTLEAQPSVHSSVHSKAPTPEPVERAPVHNHVHSHVHSHGPAHAEILGLLGPTPVAEDQLLRDLNLASSQLTPALTILEMEGKIARQPGGLLCRL